MSNQIKVKKVFLYSDIKVYKNTGIYKIIEYIKKDKYYTYPFFIVL